MVFSVRSEIYIVQDGLIYLIFNLSEYRKVKYCFNIVLDYFLLNVFVFRNNFETILPDISDVVVLRVDHVESDPKETVAA